MLHAEDGDECLARPGVERYDNVAAQTLVEHLLLVAARGRHLDHMAGRNFLSSPFPSNGSTRRRKRGVRSGCLSYIVARGKRGKPQKTGHAQVTRHHSELTDIYNIHCIIMQKLVTERIQQLMMDRGRFQTPYFLCTAAPGYCHALRIENRLISGRLCSHGPLFIDHDDDEHGLLPEKDSVEKPKMSPPSCFST